ncbi:MAG: hypothetical protein ACXV2C_03670 [Candidatus Bathyarchaeia archaeon]
MKIFVLMKNGWPVSSFQFEWQADRNLDAAKSNEPNNHWMLIEIPFHDD